LAFSQIDLLGPFEWSLDVLWISLSMIAVMGLIMLTAMIDVLPNRRIDVALYATFGLRLVRALAAGRLEAMVGTRPSSAR
jgi:hypothetical protein